MEHSDLDGLKTAFGLVPVPYALPLWTPSPPPTHTHHPTFPNTHIAHIVPNTHIAHIVPNTHIGLVPVTLCTPPMPISSEDGPCLCAFQTAWLQMPRFERRIGAVTDANLCEKTYHGPPL